ncbi:RNA polymerase sigma factor [Streptomyces spiralis]
MSSQANATISHPEAVTDLVTRAIAGDRQAFATLYNDHKPEVYRFLAARVRDRELAEDLTQETFTRALAKMDSFRVTRGAGFLGWLYTIARNIHLDHVKKAGVRLEISFPEIYDTGALEDSAETYALRDLETAALAEQVAAAIGRLTPAQRDCVRARYLEERSIPETAAILGKGVPATKTTTWRAMQHLKRSLAREAVAA